MAIDDLRAAVASLRLLVLNPPFVWIRDAAGQASLPISESRLVKYRDQLGDAADLAWAAVEAASAVDEPAERAEWFDASGYLEDIEDNVLPRIREHVRETMLSKIARSEGGP